MYGLDKPDKDKFLFDMEAEFKKDPNKKKDFLSKIEKTILNIKETLKKGSDKKSLDDLGILLSGYQAAEKVVKRMEK
ncbi:MAG: hypothetical protein A2888_01460 [Chlamydiae bacterium RIFCSPLOWO2_01_FULL_28_7]|nr:MAG: hypothetical protein A2888_01460 [Chlamydiae bacterium RIFCSPLOWO2_01_FULL_28_7]